MAPLADPEKGNWVESLPSFEIKKCNANKTKTEVKKRKGEQLFYLQLFEFYI